jgi:hypothetical protein
VARAYWKLPTRRWLLATRASTAPGIPVGAESPATHLAAPSNAPVRFSIPTISAPPPGVLARQATSNASWSAAARLWTSPGRSRPPASRRPASSLQSTDCRSASSGSTPRAPSWRSRMSWARRTMGGPSARQSLGGELGVAWACRAGRRPARSSRRCSRSDTSSTSGGASDAGWSHQGRPRRAGPGSGWPGRHHRRRSQAGSGPPHGSLRCQKLNAATPAFCASPGQRTRLWSAVMRERGVRGGMPLSAHHGSALGVCPQCAPSSGGGSGPRQRPPRTSAHFWDRVHRPTRLWLRDRAQRPRWPAGAERHGSDDGVLPRRLLQH